MYSLDLPQSPTDLTVKMLHAIADSYLSIYSVPSKWKHKFFASHDPNAYEEQLMWANKLMAITEASFNQESAWFMLAKIWHARTWSILNEQARCHFESAFHYPMDGLLLQEGFQVMNQLIINAYRSYHFENTVNSRKNME